MPPRPRWGSPAACWRRAMPRRPRPGCARRWRPTPGTPIGGGCSKDTKNDDQGNFSLADGSLFWRCHVRATTAVRQAALWLFAIFLAYVFSRQGFTKFSSSSGWATAFRAWHYPDWFRIGVGIAEVTAAGVVLIPRAAFAGGALIGAVMLGGMGTHVYWGHPAQVTSEILPLTLATVVALGRRREFLALEARRERA